MARLVKKFAIAVAAVMSATSVAASEGVTAVSSPEYDQEYHESRIY